MSYFFCNSLFSLSLFSLQYQADEFAVGLGYGGPLQSGLVKLQLENLSNMNPDPWYSTYHHSHPVLVERLTAIRHKRKHD